MNPLWNISHIKSTRPREEVSEPAPRLCDLALLAPLAWTGPLVAAAEPQDDPVAASVAEHAQQDALAAGLVARRLAKRAQDLASVVSQAELEQVLAELLAVAATADADALDLEDVAQRDADRAPLECRQFLPQPSQDRLSPLASA